MQGDAQLGQLQCLRAINVVQHHSIAGIAAGLFEGAPREGIFEHARVQGMPLAGLAKPLQLIAIARVVIGCGQHRDQILDETKLVVSDLEAVEKKVEVWNELIDRDLFFAEKCVIHECHLHMMPDP